MFYERIDQVTAEAGIRVKAKTIEDLLCKVLLATFNEITDIDQVEEKTSKEIRAENSIPFLIADLINSALVVHERDSFVARSCEVLEFKETFARLRLKGEAFDPGKHTSKLQIKAATYYGLKLYREGDLWVAEVVYDV